MWYSFVIGIMVIVCMIIVPASGYHTDVPECVDGDVGWYMVSGNDEIGLTVFLVHEPVKYQKDANDPNKFIPVDTPLIICGLRSDAIVYVFRGKRV